MAKKNTLLTAFVKIVNLKNILSLLLILLFITPGFAEQVSVTSSIDTTVATIGDHLRLTVTIKHPESHTVIFPEELNLGKFKILNQNTRTDKIKRGYYFTKRIYTVTTFDTGAVTIPAFTIRVGPESGSEKLEEYKTSAVNIRVVSVLSKQAAAPRDIKGPFPIRTIIPFDIIIFVIVIIILSLGLYFSWKKWKEKHQKEKIIKEDYLQPPHVTAFKKLKELRKNSNLNSREALKSFYFKMSEILRGYIERRFFIYALEMSTSEIVQVSDNFDINESLIDELKSILREIDIVKYANYNSDQQEALNKWEKIYSWIQNTKQEPYFTNRSGLTETLEEMEINKT